MGKNTTGAEILIASEKISSQAEVSGIHRTYSSVSFTPARTVPGSGTRTGWGLRMIRNGKLGVAGEWGEPNPFDLVDRAIGSCRYGPGATFSFPSISPESPPDIADGLTSSDHDTVTEYFLDIQKGISGFFPKAALSARANWGQDSFLILNSNGLRGSYSKSRASISLSVSLPSSEGLLQSGFSVETSCSLPSVNDIIELLVLPLSSAGLEAGESVGRKRVVLSPLAFSVLLQGVKTGVSGRLLASGASPLEAMEGKQVLNSSLTIRDMPELSNGAASAPFDSEGIPSLNKTLFDKGLFSGFIHDLRSASECGTESTGSSGRNLGEHSRPVCTNIAVDPSEGVSADTLQETGSGILVTDVLSAGGSNAVSGQFTFDCGRVFLFRRGEVCGYCDGCVINGNVYDALSRVNTTGGRQYRVGSDLLPFISLDGISVR